MGATGAAIAAYAGTAAGATTIISGVSAVYGIAQGQASRQDAKEAARSSAEAQSRAQGEQKAQAASKAAVERRQQIREERVKQARVMQAGENTGVAGGSGEAGALGSLATQLDTNLGLNAGAIASAGRQSGYLQQAADANFQMQDAMNKAGNYDKLTSMSMNIFGSAYGASTKPKGPSAPKGPDPWEVNYPR